MDDNNIVFCQISFEISPSFLPFSLAVVRYALTERQTSCTA
ncbi:hypothetical protein HMPREF3226_02400 [Prevotella corporis]|uniref:Uncharacterized protein n=1 Tax=Prevotella corporis TaxID=28128 RepID=A0A133PVT8_9BACT|nr:hypothetical protein HMPREF3226_02400 [Prevotella corporis]